MRRSFARLAAWLAASLGALVFPAHAGVITTVVDGSAGIAGNTSLQLNGTDPVISYGIDLKLATCTANCQSASPTWQLVTVDTAGTVILAESSLQLNSGNPMIAYQRGEDLKLATCTANCQSATPSWQIVTVVSGIGGFTTSPISLQLNGGNPVISYTDNNSATVKLATCTANCQSATPTWQIVTVDTGGLTAPGSLQLNGGNPVISYKKGGLSLATCTANCQSATPTWQIVLVQTGSSTTTGQYSSIQLNGGNPVISYYDSDSGANDLKLATCTANCQSATPTWQIVTIDSVGNVGRDTSLQLNGGNPVISYYDVTNHDLKLAVCTANCQSASPTWLVRTVDSLNLVGEYTSLQLSGVNAVVSYKTQTGGDLKMATITPPTVTSIVRAGANPTNAASVAFTVTFSEDVTGVDVTDFALAITGLVGASITGVTGSGATYTVTVNTGTGDGLIGVNLVDDDSIVGFLPLAGLGAGNGNFTGPTYTIDRTAPTAALVLPANGTYSAGQNLDLTLNTSEAVSVTGTPSIALTLGAAAVNATYVSGSGTSSILFRYAVVATDLDLDGISVAGALSGGSLSDAAGNVGAGTFAVGSTAGILVRTAYTVTSSAGANGTITPSGTQQVTHNATATFTVTPNANYTASVGGTCGGTLVGNTFTTNPITAPCTVVASFGVISYTVTPSAGPNGTITPNTPQTVVHGATATFTVTPSPGYAAVVGGTCGGALAGTTYTTNAITANCTVSATFTSTVVTSFTGPSSTGTGNVTASFTGGGVLCGFATSQFIPVTGHPASPPAGTAPGGVTFPHGLFDFTLSGCTPGSTITMTITYPATLPVGTLYWKYGPIPGGPSPRWYVLPATISGNVATFAITDGAMGDDDLAANGAIVDQGGPGVPGAAVATPTLSEWAMILMALLMLASVSLMRRRVR